MSLIRKSTELNIPTNVKMMIYGQAGMGEHSSFECTKASVVGF